MAIQSVDKTATVNILNGVITGVDPEHIKPGKGPNVNIIWSIASPDKDADYTFPDDGIVIKSDPDGQFTRIGPIANRKKYHVIDRNSDEIIYPYTVNIMNGTTRLAPFDPTIDNGDG